MATTLEDRIAERIARESLPNRHAQRAAFLALKEDVGRAITAGWTVKDIWRTLRAENRIQVSYQAFTTYVNRFIREPSAKPAPESPGKPAQPPPIRQSGFIFNPTPKKEDIV
jgi:hypothetical protein